MLCFFSYPSNFDIADKITVSNFRQQKNGEHFGEEIEAKPEVAIKKPKPASLEEQQKKCLSEIIEELNALYDKSYEPDSTTKTAHTNVTIGISIGCILFIEMLMKKGRSLDFDVTKELQLIQLRESGQMKKKWNIRQEL